MKIQVITCPNCNGEVQIDDSREFGFCTYCGTKVAFSREGEVNATRAFADNREAALYETKRLIDYFHDVQEFIEELDEINDFLKVYKKNEFTSKIVVGVSVAIFGFVFLILGIITDSVGVGFFMGVIPLAIGIVRAVIFIRANKQNEDYYKYSVPRKKELSKYLIEYYNSCPRCPIGIEYCRDEVLRKIYDYIRKGRAETIKEAINLMDTDEYNQEMRRIAIDTKDIAERNMKANQLNATVNTLRFLSK